MARMRSHASAYNAAPLYSPGNSNLSLKNTLLGYIDPSIDQAMPSKLICNFAFPLEQIFLTRKFPIFVVIIFFFIFFLSHRPCGQRKPGKGLLFAPNVSSAMEVCIVTKRSFISCSTTQQQITRGLQLHVSERLHFTTATPSAHALCQFFAHTVKRVVCRQFPSSQHLTASTATLFPH